MKRCLSLALAAAMAFTLTAGCGKQPVEESVPEEEPVVITDTAEHLNILLPASANKSVVEEHADAFCQALRDEMARQGWQVDTITVNVAETETASGKALDDGTADLAVMPANQYFPYSDSAVLLMTATKAGLSVASTDPAKWNGGDDAPEYTDEDCPYGRTLICATMSETGRELAQKSENGTLTWEDLEAARWLVPKVSSSSDFIYPDLWLQSHFGKTTEDLPHILSIDGYSALFTEAGSDAADVVVIAADMRIDYSAAWQMGTNDIDYTGKMGLGHEDSIFNDIQVLGVTEPVYGDVLALCTSDETLNREDFHTALLQAMDTLEANADARAVWGACGYTGFTATGDSYYDNIRELAVLGVGD